MNSNGTIRVAIASDDSADWRVCGLRQIDRITRAVEHFARTSGRAVAWSDDAANADVALTTRMVLRRDSIAELLNGRESAARMLASPAEIPAAEYWLARDLGKPQDGWVARHIDRRISTAITRVLLRRTGIRPIHATLAAFAFALAGCLLLARGSYSAVVAGTLLFYVFSILDGCDGEIARALYAESESGARIDFLFDTIANVLFILTLGVGLRFLWEGIASALLITIAELLLAFGNDVEASPLPRDGRLYARHARMLGHSGALIFGERVVYIATQLMKRDIAWVAFVLLAVCNLAAWILHLSLAAALVTSTFAAIAAIRQPSAGRI